MDFKILIAEDEVAMRSMLVDFLSDCDYEVLEAENGQVAWELWNKNKCNLLITDINMPLLNGIDLLKKIKLVDKNFPVIVVTGVTIENARSEAVAFGADAFLAKPFKMKDLLVKINELSNT